MPSAAEVQSLHELAAYVASGLGLDLNDKNGWSYNDSIDYIEGLRLEILSRANSFSPEVVAIAQAVDEDRRRYDWQAMFQNTYPEIFVREAFSRGADMVVGTYNLGADAVRAAANAISAATRSLSYTSAIAPYVVPVAIGFFMYLAIKSTGKDPGGQFSKFVGAVRGKS